MKLNHTFILVVILIILFSLGTVVASENLTIDSNSEDALAIGSHGAVINVLNEDSGVNQDILNSNLSLSDESHEDVDLSVRLDVENVYGDNNEFNREGFNVPWNITAKVTGGTAKNTKVHGIFSDNLEYVSHIATVGEYNSNNGIWDIGDLNDSARLTIVTKLKSGDKFTVNVTAATDSNDIKFSNNNDYLYIKSGTSKSTSNTTQTSDDVGGAVHQVHQNSRGSGVVERGHGETQEVTNSNMNSKEAESKSNSKLGSNSNSKRNALVKQVGFKSVTPTLSRAYGTLSNLVDSVLNPGSSASNDANSNSKSNSPNLHSGVAIAQDYTTIPLLIFSLFLVALVAMAGYDKIKS